MPTHGTVTFWDFIFFGIYIVASIALGLSFGGKQKNLQTYLLAGHSMHWSIVGISVLAGLFSGITFLGAPAETYGHNLMYMWALISFVVATPITALVFLPFFYRLNFYTAYEYLEHRFDRRLRKISSATFIFRVCFWLALALNAPALVISEMMGIPLWISILVTGLCTTLYTAVGGMKAVIYTDVMQFCVLVTGIACICFIAIHKIPGGFSGAWTIAEAGGRARFLDFSFSPSVRVTVWAGFFGGMFSCLVLLVTDQIAVQRYLTATSMKEAQKALWFKLLLTVPLSSTFYLTGLVLYSFYKTHPDMAATLTSSDRLLPNFVSHEIPSPMPGLLVAAILSATMSTASAGLNSLTTATLMDFFITNREATNAQGEKIRVRNARRWTVFYGCVITSFGLIVSSLGTLVEASVKISGYLGGPLLGIFFLGVLSGRSNARGTLIGAIIGFSTTVYISLFTHVSFMWYALIGTLVTYFSGEAFSRLFPKPSDYQRSFSLRPARPVKTTEARIE